ncbi:MAG: histidine kinase [Microlunatus sp.]
MGNTPPAGFRSRLNRVIPVVAAPATITAFTAIGAIQTHREPLVAAALCLLVVLTSAVLVRIGPTGRPLLLGLTVFAAVVIAACWGDPRNLGWFGMCVIAGWAALMLPNRWGIPVGAALATAFLVMVANVSREPGWVTWTLGVALTCGAFVFIRRQRELVERLHEAQSELAEHARADERHRIARELHDLVGHSLTVALLHLGSARLALDDDLDVARAALAEAESATRDSLDDVRAAVGLMRSVGPAAAAPAPGIADIPDLVDSYRNAGADIDLDVRKAPTGMAASRGLTAYRIVQESLTNAVRHGDGGPISVRVDAAKDRTEITVRNSAAVRAQGPSGTGVAAMRERVAALGGTLSARPARGGWLVEAVIPT